VKGGSRALAHLEDLRQRAEVVRALERAQERVEEPTTSEGAGLPAGAGERRATYE
jgi:hypothetical protein